MQKKGKTQQSHLRLVLDVTNHDTIFPSKNLYK